jgi:hypothetical protein
MNLHPFEREYNEGLSGMGRGEEPAYWFWFRPTMSGHVLAKLAIERPLGGSYLAKNGIMATRRLQPILDRGRGGRDYGTRCKEVEACKGKDAAQDSGAQLPRNRTYSGVQTRPDPQGRRGWRDLS